MVLTVEVAKTLVGKTISWRAPFDEENWDDYDTPKFFGGKCIIKEINSDNRRALKCETISGNDLSFAILENEEMQPVNGSETRFSLCPAVGDKRTFTYSDLYREVEIIDIKETEVEEDDEDEEHADNILEVMFEGDCTAEAKNFEQYLIEFFKMKRLNAGAKVQIIKANYNDRTLLSGVYRVDEAKKIKKYWFSLDSFLANIADNIGFEIAERQQTSDSYTLVNFWSVDAALKRLYN
jgi:hypothetical protein